MPPTHTTISWCFREYLWTGANLKFTAKFKTCYPQVLSCYTSLPSLLPTASPITFHNTYLEVDATSPSCYATLALRQGCRGKSDTSFVTPQQSKEIKPTGHTWIDVQMLLNSRRLHYISIYRNFKMHFIHQMYWASQFSPAYSEHAQHTYISIQLGKIIPLSPPRNRSLRLNVTTWENIKILGMMIST